MGLVIGFVNRFTAQREVNPFFSTIMAAFLMALPAYLAAGLGWLDNPNAANIGALMARKHLFFVPFGQDDPAGKPNSLVADFSRIGETAEAALSGEQLQPILLGAEKKS